MQNVTRPIRIWAYAFAIVLGNSVTARAQCETAVTAPDATGLARFGFAMAVNGDTVVVGAPQDSDAGERSGAAYVYRREGINWIFESKLTAGDASAYDLFGYGVAVNENRIVVASLEDNGGASRSGSAYVFRREGFDWVEEAKLTPADPSSYQRFGRSLAIDADTIVIGAYEDDENGLDAGAVYVFQREGDGTTWIQAPKLTPSDSAIQHEFGYAVAISNDTILAGAPGDDDNGSFSGSTYVYRRNQSDNTWYQETKLTAGDAMEEAAFGVSVAIHEDTVVVAAFRSSLLVSTVYLFKREGTDLWVEESKLTASDGTAGDAFGEFVSIDADTIVIGAPHDDDVGNNSGSAYVYQWNPEESDWTELIKLTASDAFEDEFFGRSGGVSGSTIAIGAYSGGADVGGYPNGAAYMYTDHAESTVRGDLGCDGIVDLTDILCMLDAFGGVREGCSVLDRADIAGVGGTCDPDGIVDLQDILAVLDAFSGGSNCSL